MAKDNPDPGSSLIASDVQVQPVRFSDLDGWTEDAPEKAFQAFLRSCRHRRDGDAEPRPAQPSAELLLPICRTALNLSAPLGSTQARAFFEDAFQPYEIRAEMPLVTAYFEPVVDGALNRTDVYRYPLYALPDDVPDVPETYFSRSEITDGALSGRGLELVWLADPVDAYFIHIQGSTRVRLDDGSLIRIGFAGKNGHPYASVGRAMLDDQVLQTNQATAEDMKDWLRAHPAEARTYMDLNPSYVFFRRLDDLAPDLGPIGGEGVPLTAGRSLAIDWRLFAYGLPFWIEAELPSAGDAGAEPFRRLTIAQDTGAAIVGPARGDIFWGTGPEAGVIAGRMRHPARFVVFLPRAAMR